MNKKFKNLAIASINRSHLYKLSQILNKYNNLDKFYAGFPSFKNIDAFSKNTILKEHHHWQSLFKLRKYIFLENKNLISNYLASKSSNNFDLWLCKEIEKDSIEILISEGFYSSKSGIKLRKK